MTSNQPNPPDPHGAGPDAAAGLARIPDQRPVEPAAAADQVKPSGLATAGLLRSPAKRIRPSCSHLSLPRTMIRSTGYVTASRPSRHAGPVQAWDLVSEQAGRNYLARTAGNGPASPAVAAAPPDADPAGAATGQHASHAPCPAGDRPGDPPAARPAGPDAPAGTPGPSAKIAGSLFDDDPDREELEEQGWIMAGNRNRRGLAGGGRTSRA